MINIILSTLFAFFGIYSTFKMKQAKDNKDLFRMIDEMYTSILAYLAMMLIILTR